MWGMHASTYMQAIVHNKRTHVHGRSGKKKWDSIQGPFTVCRVHYYVYGATRLTKAGFCFLSQKYVSVRTV